MIRWVKFNAVGLMGIAVQLLALQGLIKLGVSYLAATVLAVETALLHNYFWHRRWTWKERGGSLLRFQLGTGVVSILGNLALMRVFKGGLGIPAVPANLMAIALTGLVNFFLGERWVFANAPPLNGGQRTQPGRWRVRNREEGWRRRA